MKHALPEQIVAFRDGELTDHKVEGHIRNCPLCRRQLGEARWVRTHTLSHILKPRGPKPTHDEISAYLDEALDEKEMDRVEIHIRTSDHILAVFDKLLMLSMKLEHPLPNADMVADLKAKLRGPRLLGRLRVFVTDRYKQVFHPARTVKPIHARAVRMLQEEGQPLPCMEAELCYSKEPPVCKDSAAAPPPPPKPSNPRLIDTGRWLIRAVTRGTVGEALLELVIEESTSGSPVPKVPLKLVPESDDPVHALTDGKGSARIPLPDGESSLEIGEGPDLILEINAELDPQQNQE
jgi:hypothetical protein